MLEEQAFLDAIAANPFDDTPRLVYADWLDEHGEPAKAAYLRLVVGLVPLLADEDPDPAFTERLMENATLLPLDWRMAAAARFMVVLYGYERDQKIQTIKVVRELLWYGLAESKRFAESLPARFPVRTTLEGAMGIRARLRSAARCTVRVHPCDAPELPRIAGYRISAEIMNYSYYENPEDPPPLSAEAVQEFRDFLIAALAISPATADERIYDSVELAAGLEPPEAERRVRAIRALLAPQDPNRGWEIVVHSYYQLSPPPSR